MTRPWWQQDRARSGSGPSKQKVLEALLIGPAGSLEELYDRLPKDGGYPATNLGNSVRGIEKKGLVKTTWKGCGHGKRVELTDRGRRATEKMLGRKQCQSS